MMRLRHVAAAGAACVAAFAAAAPVPAADAASVSCLSQAIGRQPLRLQVACGHGLTATRRFGTVRAAYVEHRRWTGLYRSAVRFRMSTAGRTVRMCLVVDSRGWPYVASAQFVNGTYGGVCR